MTIGELLDAVSRLGFQTEPEEEWEDAFYEAVNHALCEIRRVLPEYASAKLSHYPATPIRVCQNQILGKDGIAFDVSDAGAIEFSLSGYADLVLSSAAGRLKSERIGVPMPGVSIHRYLVSDLIPEGGSDDITISLTRRGACRVSIRYWAAGEVSSLDMPAEDGAYTVYDLSQLFADFGSLKQVRYGNHGNCDFRIDHQSSLVLRTDATGDYTVVYRKAVPRLDKERDREIPLSEDESDLLTLLVASYVLLDENDGKSAWYREKYDRGIAMLLRRRKPLRERGVYDRYGW